MNQTRSTNLPTMWALYFVCCLTWITSTPATAAPIPLAEYHAGNNSVAWSPLQWGWYDTSDLGQPMEGYGYGVTGTAGGGVTAWQIANPGISGVQPHYFFFLQGSTFVSAAKENGWNLEAKAQLVNMQQGVANQGLSVQFEGRYYGVALQRNSAGDLIASILTSASESTALVLSDSSQAGDYHDYELRATPNSSQVSFFFNGEEKYTWGGVFESHPNKFQFGSLSDLGAGSINFREVYSSILDSPPDPTEFGDYNGDGIVNLADYTVWRNTLGSTSQLAADGNGNFHIDAGDYNVWKNNFGREVPSASGALGEQTVPENSTAALALLALAACAWKAKRAGLQNEADRPF